MKIAYLGGSFDPPHLGHLAIARAARAARTLDRVVLVVAARPPHKRALRQAPAADRYAMARAAASEEPWLAVDDREIRRPGLSFTVETVREILAERPLPEETWWLVGADTLPELPTWREYRTILDLVPFLVAARPGFDAARALDRLAPHVPSRVLRSLAEGIIPMDPVDISSTMVRDRLRDGHPVTDLVPEAVGAYLARSGLYRS